MKPFDSDCSLRKIGRSLLKFLPLESYKATRLNPWKVNWFGQETYRNRWITRIFRQYSRLCQAMAPISRGFARTNADQIKTG